MTDSHFAQDEAQGQQFNLGQISSDNIVQMLITEQLNKSFKLQ